MRDHNHKKLESSFDLDTEENLLDLIKNKNFSAEKAQKT
jgi:hypothetical protein